MRAPRALLPGDRRRIAIAGAEWAAAGSFLGLRTRALVTLAAGSGLRIGECIKLDLDQVLEATSKHHWRVCSSAYVRVYQAKGRRKVAPGKRWSSAGTFIITKPARVALRRYIKEAIARGWIELPPAPGEPLFIAVKDGGHHHAGPHHHDRLGKRMAQRSWEMLQERAQIPYRYGFHCLRHDALTRFAEAAGGDVFRVAAFGRCNIKTAQRYVHVDPVAIAEIAEIAARLRRDPRAAAAS